MAVAVHSDNQRRVQTDMRNHTLGIHDRLFSQPIPIDEFPLSSRVDGKIPDLERGDIFKTEVCISPVQK